MEVSRGPLLTNTTRWGSVLRMRFPFHAARPMRVWLLASLLLLATLAVYAPVRHHEFNAADRAAIPENARVRTGLSPANAGWAFTTFRQARWQPATWLSHMADAELFGTAPGGHHLTNLLLHAANVALLFLFFEAATGSLPGSALLAALFAVHPLHVESVAWVAERGGLLSMAFLLITLSAYLRYLRRPGPRPYLLLLAAYGAGLMAGPTLVTLPFAMLLLDFWPLGRMGRPAAAGGPLPLLREKAPLFLMAAAACAVAYAALQGGDAAQSVAPLPLALRLPNLFASCASYLAKTAWPTDLAVVYPLPQAALDLGKVLAGAAAVALLSSAATLLRRRLPFALVGWLWFLGALAPVVWLAQPGDQAMADRFTYIPLAGLFLACAWTLFPRAAGGRARRAAAALAAAAIVLACAMAARLQLGFWRDDVTLFGRALAVTPDTWAVHDGLASGLAAQGNLGEALLEYRRVFEFRPAYAEGYFKMGMALVGMERDREAIDIFRGALSLKGDLAPAHAELARALAREGIQQEAVDHFGKAVELDPCAAGALADFGALLAARGSGAEAEGRYREAIRCEPDSAGAHYGLAALQAGQGRDREAAGNLAAALRLKPDYPAARALLERIGKSPRK
jgi:tetratricopeptide (TPR) repeat protein